jgi:hypothetical protein
LENAILDFGLEEPCCTYNLPTYLSPSFFKLVS